MESLHSNPLKRRGYKRLTLEYVGQRIPAYYFPFGKYIYFRYSYPEPDNIGWKRQTKEQTGYLFKKS